MRKTGKEAPTREKKRVGVWLRVSTEDQVRGESPEHHERRACLYAEAKDWEIVTVYRLDAVSGKSVLHHAETKRMLADIREGRIDALIFSKLARLARNTKELLEFSEIFRESNADLISLYESIDTSTPAGRLFYTMIAAMAQWEREEIADRIAASVPIRAKLGKPLGGISTYGYQWKDGKLIPDPTEAPVRRLMYELFVEHRRRKTVATLLNQAGYRTRGGRLWSATSIRRLLLDPTAKGLHRANYSSVGGEKQTKIFKPESEWVYTPVEPIVDSDLWDRCYAILKEQETPKKRPAKRTVHLLSGITRCTCGDKMYVPSNSPKYTCQKCRNKIPVDDLDAIFYEQLKGFFVSPTDVAAYLAEADETLKEKEQLLAVIEKEEKDLKEGMDKLVTLYMDGEIPSKGFGDRYRPLEERLGQLQDELPRVQAEIDFLKISYLSRDQILADARDLYARWPQLSFGERRKIVETITESITVGDGEITIDLCYLPSVEDMANCAHTLYPAFPFCHQRLTTEKPDHSKQRTLRKKPNRPSE